MKQVGATLVAVEASKEAGGADLPGGLGPLGPGPTMVEFLIINHINNS